MKFLYVDESGDSGRALSSPTQYFFLASLAVDTVDLPELLTDLHRFRQHLSAKYSLLISEEIHASAFMSSPGFLVRISLNDRLRILLECLDWCRQRTDLKLLTVGIDKRQSLTNTVFQDAWRQLLLLFDEYLSGVAAGLGPAQGLIFCDNTDGAKLTGVVRSLQQAAALPDAPAGPALHHLIGDPVLHDSRRSHLLQMADVIAYFATQLVTPNQRIRKKGAHHHFRRLMPVNLLADRFPDGIMLL